MPAAIATVGLVESDRDLQGVFELQRASRPPTPDGFVTVEHTLDILRRIEPAHSDDFLRTKPS